MLSGDFWDRRFCRISTIPANALSGGLIGAVKLHSRLYLLASITLSKTGTFFPSVTLSVIIHCSSLTIGGPGLHWAIKQGIFPPTASHFNAFQNTTGAHAQAHGRARPLRRFGSPPAGAPRSLSGTGWGWRLQSQQLELSGLGPTSGTSRRRGSSPGLTLLPRPRRGGRRRSSSAAALPKASLVWSADAGKDHATAPFERGVGMLLLRQSLDDSRGRRWRSGGV